MDEDRFRIEFRPTDDYDAMVRLGRLSGLEVDDLGTVLAAYGAFEGDELVGCACLKQRQGAYLLECLAVAERLRGTGVGTRLVRMVESDATARGATSMFALARSPGFFQKVGYRIVEPGEVDYPNLASCAGCSQFKNTCHPAVVTRDL